MKIKKLILSVVISLSVVFIGMGISVDKSTVLELNATTTSEVVDSSSEDTTLKEEIVGKYDDFMEFLKQPLPIISISIFQILVFVYVILKNTSFGKRNIKLLNDKYNKSQEIVRESLATIDRTNKVVDLQREELGKLIDFLGEFSNIQKNVKVKKTYEKLLIDLKEHYDEKGKEN